MPGARLNYNDPNVTPPQYPGYSTIWDSVNRIWTYRKIVPVVTIQPMPNPAPVSVTTSFIDTITSFVQTNPVTSIAIAGGIYYLFTKKK